MHLPKPDMSCILPPTNFMGALYLGNMDAASDLAYLAEHSVKAILTVCPQSIPTSVRNAMVMVKQLPADDDDSYPIDRHFDEAALFIQSARQRTNVLVHCQMGISRSATIVIAYLVKHQLIGVREALRFVEQRRSQIFPNNGFLRQLGKFERLVFRVGTEEEPESFEVRMQKLRESRGHRELMAQTFYDKFQPRKYERPDLGQSLKSSLLINSSYK